MMTYQEHQELGGRLKEIHAFLLPTYVDLSRSYGKTAPVVRKMEL